MRVFTNAREALDLLNAEDRAALEGKHFIPGDGDPNADLILVKDFPTWKEARSSRIFMGDEGVAVRKAALDLGIRIYTTSTFPFFYNNGQYKLNDIRRAAEIVRYEIEQVGAKKIVLFGAKAASACPVFQAPFKKFTDLLNREFKDSQYEFRVVQHPVQLASSPQLYRSFIDTLQRFHLGITATPDVQRVDSEHYAVHTGRSEAERVLAAMDRNAERVAVDLETTGLDRFSDRIITIQLSWIPGRGHAFPWELFTPDEWAKYLGGKKLIFQNGAFDVKFLAENGVYVEVAEDTMLMHSLVDETPGTHNMEALAQRYLNIDKWSDMVDYDNMALEEIETLGVYGARDADITLRLANVFRPLVENRHIHKVLHRAQNAVIRAELRGVKVNRELAFEMQEEIASALESRRDLMADTFGLENPNSPKQVQEVLYKKLGLPVQKFKGKVTTNEEAMIALAEMHSLPKQILEYRHLTKASGTYLANILAGSEHDGRYHGDFRLAATETGRLTEKLLMLIPRPDNVEGADLGKTYQYRLRELFIPDEGHLMIGADYSGLEVTMAAYLTGDRQLIQDITNKLDTHSIVAIQAFNLPISYEPIDTLKKRVQAEHAYQRELAKRGTFTWLYGGGESALAANVGTDLGTARQILRALRERYQGVARWQDSIRATAQREGSVSTPWGRTRRFFFNEGLSRRVLEEQLREAINTPNQGMSSDINLAAFEELDRRGFAMLFPFHDAIYLQVPETQVEIAAKQVKSVMANVIQSPVPFRADVKWGTTWATLG